MSKILWSFLFYVPLFQASGFASPLTYLDLQVHIPAIHVEDANLVLSQNEVIEDVALFQYALARAYGGVSTIPVSTIESVSERLGAIQASQTIQQLCDLLGATASALPDGHFGVYIQGRNCLNRHPKILDLGQNSNQSESNWQISLRRTGNKSVLLIAITSFPQGIWPGFEDELRGQLKLADAVIIDLRSNGGGNDSNGLLMANLIAGQKVITPFNGVIERKTPETLMIWLNELNLMLYSLKPDPVKNKEAIESLNVLVAETESDLQMALAGKLQEFKTTPADNGVDFDPSKAFKGPIYILQDKKCGSSCESTINFFENIPNVKRIGDYTIGEIQFGNVGVFQLPHSGIGVQMPTKANLYTNHRTTELIGIKPDIQLRDGDDALQYALDLMK